MRSLSYGSAFACLQLAALDDLEVQRLRKDELLTIDSEREADTAAGWRVG